MDCAMLYHLLLLLIPFKSMNEALNALWRLFEGSLDVKSSGVIWFFVTGISASSEAFHKALHCQWSHEAFLYENLEAKCMLQPYIWHMCSRSVELFVPKNPPDQHKIITIHHTRSFNLSHWSKTSLPISLRSIGLSKSIGDPHRLCTCRLSAFTYSKNKL